MNTSTVGTRPYLSGLEPENLKMSDPLRCTGNSKHSETFIPTLYMLNLYISMIFFYISISYFQYHLRVLTMDNQDGEATYKLVVL